MRPCSLNPFAGTGVKKGGGEKGEKKKKEALGGRGQALRTRF